MPFSRPRAVIAGMGALVALSLTCLTSCFVPAGAAPISGAERLWFAKPAAKWTEAMPVGNGRMGAMVFGGIADERIQFNEDTLWTGSPHDYVRAGAASHLAEIRQLITNGKTDDAAKVVKASFLSDPIRQKAYQPFGDLRLHFSNVPMDATAVNEYLREIDLAEGVARVSYRASGSAGAQGVVYRREVFASYPDNIVVVRLTADQPRHISFTLAMDSPHPGSRTRVLGKDTLVLSGQVETGGLRFESRIRMIATGGTVRTGETPETPGSNGNSSGTIAVEGADSVTLVLAAATSFRNFQDIRADPAARCASTLKHVQGHSFDRLRADHERDYQALFGRVRIDLGHSEHDTLPTDQRIADVKMGGLDADPALAALYFQFGRYLLISSSRPGSQPANLQGIWNDQMDPPWESKWTTNINVEMNYWPAEVANLSECHLPLFDMIDDLVISGSRTAKSQYSCRGWVLHHNTDIWRGTAPINGIDGVWPTGGAWLCQHLWEHYLFTGDKKFLADRAYPAMKSASEFFADYLVPDAKSGTLVSSPSYSPEQGTLTAGPAMDRQLIRALLAHTIQAAAILKRDASFAAKLTEIRGRVAPDRIGQHGQLQEWMDDIDQPNNNHRHMSPLWALYPGDDITPADTATFSAAKLLMQWRGDGSTGWSYAWRMPLWARAGDGAFAYRQLTQLFQRKTLPNLFDLCGPFQIDGNFGATAGIAEMLLQSYQTDSGSMESTTVPACDPARAASRTLDLLPALPAAWPSGSVHGLCVRGDSEVDLDWKNGSLARAVLRTHQGGHFRVRIPGRSVELDTQPGHEYVLNGQLRVVSDQSTVARAAL